MRGVHQGHGRADQRGEAQRVERVADHSVSVPTGHFGRFVGIGFGRTTMGRQSAGGRSPGGWPMRAMGPQPDARRGGGPSRVSIPSARTRGPGSSSPRTAAPCDRGTRACPLDDERSKDRGSDLGLGQSVGEWPQADRLVQAGDNRRCGAEGSGSSDRSRSVQIRSPTTALEAQFFVDRGGRKSSGFTNSHADETTSGINERRPIHFLLQIEPASIGRTAKRVQTLAGFEWRIQLSSLSPNAPAIALAEVDPTFLTGHCRLFEDDFCPHRSSRGRRSEPDLPTHRRCA
jgi:hypothetical protein